MNEPDPSEPPRLQTVQHNPASARVPEKVGRGVFCTGALVAYGQHEFIIDFIQRMNSPHQIVARVILPFSIIPAFIAALRENLQKHQTKVPGAPAVPPPAPAPTPPPDAAASAQASAGSPAPAGGKQAAPTGPPPPTVEEIYDNLKLPDEMLAGTYANCVMVIHSATDFCLDFITNFYPRSAVSCRVFMSSGQVPALLTSLQGSFQKYQQTLG